MAPANKDGIVSVTGTAVEIFTDRDFKGVGLVLHDGNDDPETDGGSVGNDTISSIKAGVGWKVTVHANSDFTGAGTTFHGSTAYVGDEFDDTISSLKVRSEHRSPLVVDETINGSRFPLAGLQQQDSLGVDLQPDAVTECHHGCGSVEPG
ncbi:hypothetical protein ACFV0O_40225 [Kitasatospora sp. NPDC059577]|uniref:hypothetical protein n=1 Tax=Kitasatospora sp. NPDC059577 TaxID=3346873 RepID=UPI003693448E